jgi:hypothetical protein
LADILIINHEGIPVFFWYFFGFICHVSAKLFERVWWVVLMLERWTWPWWHCWQLATPIVNVSHCKPFGGFLKWGYPKIDGLFHGNTIYKWMITRGTQYFRDTSISCGFTGFTTSRLSPTWPGLAHPHHIS